MRREERSGRDLVRVWEWAGEVMGGEVMGGEGSVLGPGLIPGPWCLLVRRGRISGRGVSVARLEVSRSPGHSHPHSPANFPARGEVARVAITPGCDSVCIRRRCDHGAGVAVSGSNLVWPRDHHQ